ncbi:hypothetical protein C2S53_003406 [Perilla frutescens var. hirtella]|uniref:Glycosyltransferase 61 catalytic domain-containing protein n=1 Tax=Perilla frutescens var. hirtella TaxID=608512 RepID=A0AAD4ISU9_PERFH|nr:hypothetical protein C2S53_003406 [Perilla frutescens var. hirtella]
MIWNYSNSRTDAYEVEGDIRIQGSSSTIFIASNSSSGGRRRAIHITVKPHPRKFDKSAMVSVRSFKMKTGPPDTIPQCTRIMEVPAILFSTGGHVGNHFHRITDVFVPLFATSQQFHRRVLFLVTNRDSQLTSNYRETLERLSEYVVRDIDGDDEILCFPRMMVGLKASKLGLSIDPTPSSSFSMRNFSRLLRAVYSLKRESVDMQPWPRPRMLLVTRGSSRRLTNHVEVGNMARSLGFEVVAQDFGGNVTSIAELVNAADVMVGVHGAGLTNMVFLPENAVVIQITPLGMDHFAEICYGRVPAEEMKLKYLEYMVMLNESSLAGKYPDDSEVYKNSVDYCLAIGFSMCKKVFMDNQDVTLHLPTFRKTLSQALDLLTVAASA